LLEFLVPKLPTPREEDLAKGILESIDMDSYRLERNAAMEVALAAEDAEIGPVPVGGGEGRKAEPEIDRLSNIVRTFDEPFGTLFDGGDRIVGRIHDDIAPKVAEAGPYRNARRNTPGTARIEPDAALKRVMRPLPRDGTKFYEQFMRNESFRRFVTGMVLWITDELCQLGQHAVDPEACEN
jgi:type I restriction enzyme, R subunit